MARSSRPLGRPPARQSGSKRRHRYGLHQGPGADGESGTIPSRMLSSEDLQCIVLGLLEEHARHGYQIIKAIRGRSQDYYSPSAGMMYPALAHLAETGLASVELDGMKKLYRLTAAGHEYIAAHRERIASLLEALENVGRVGNDSLAPSEQPNNTSLAAAFRDLKAALFDSMQAPQAEQARVTQVLKRAIAEIERK